VPRALAIAAHPDDIEFVMAGTLLLLREAGWKIHYLNVSTGNFGHMTLTAAETARVRRGEAQAAAKMLGAKWHAPFCDDLQIFYTDENIRRICAVVREAKPSVVLTHALQDYMEDHMITARLAVTGTFARGLPHYRSRPPRKPTLEPVTIYHAMPHGQRDPMRQRVAPCMRPSAPRSPATRRKKSGSTPRKARTITSKRWTAFRSRSARRRGASRTRKAGDAISITASATKSPTHCATRSARNILSTKRISGRSKPASEPRCEQLGGGSISKRLSS